MPYTQREGGGREKPPPTHTHIFFFFQTFMLRYVVKNYVDVYIYDTPSTRCFDRSTILKIHGLVSFTFLSLNSNSKINHTICGRYVCVCVCAGAAAAAAATDVAHLLLLFAISFFCASFTCYIFIFINHI